MVPALIGSSGNTLGGMLEKVLRRLCPCYYSRTDESEVLCGTCEENRENSSENPKVTSRFTEGTIEFLRNDFADGGNGSFSAVDYMGGSFDLIHPQPLYALPPEKNRSVIESKSLLTPALYWKKTMKNFGPNGPPVVKDDPNHKRMHSYYEREASSHNRSQKLALKHSETVADVRSVFSGIKNVSWLRSQSLHNLPLDDSFSRGNTNEFVSIYESKKHRRKSLGVNANLGNAGSQFVCGKYGDHFPRGPNQKLRVIPDISYGVIVFSAAYHSGKKVLLLKIDHLENLSLKGRNKNPYSTVIKISVSPSEKYVKCTKVLKKSSSPEVKEDFSFTVKENSGKFLRLSVFDSVSKNPFNAVGHALLSLDGDISRHPKKFRMKLYRHTQPHITPGNLAMTLGYLHEENRLTVIVDRAKNLILQKDKNVKLNTYVKGTLYSRGVKMKTKRSALIVNSKDPVYSSAFSFSVKENDTEDLLLVVTVRLKSFVKDTTVGRVIFGPFFITDHNKLTPWGRIFLKEECVSHWFRLYL